MCGQALKRYIDTQMEPGDLVAIVRTAGGVGTLQQFTTDRRLLHLAADRVQWDFRSRHAVGFFKVTTPDTGVGDVDDSAVGEIRDAMASVGSLGALEYIARGVAELPGRKCIVFFSEGFGGMFKDRGESGRIWRAMSRMLGRANARRRRRLHHRCAGARHGRADGGRQPAADTRPETPGTYDAEALVPGPAASRYARYLLESQESHAVHRQPDRRTRHHQHERSQSRYQPRAPGPGGLLPARVRGAQGRAAQRLGPGPRQGAGEAAGTARTRAPGLLRPVRPERAERLRIRSADDGGSLPVCVERRHRAAHVVVRT